MPNKTPTTPAMEKISAVAIGASKATGEEPPVPVPASDVASARRPPPVSDRSRSAGTPTRRLST